MTDSYVTTGTFEYTPKTGPDRAEGYPYPQRQKLVQILLHGHHFISAEVSSESCFRPILLM